MSPVKYLVNVMQRAYLLQVRVPLCPAALSQVQVDRLNATFAQAAAAIEATRDALAMELQVTGVCPWCNDLQHPEGQRCSALPSS